MLFLGGEQVTCETDSNLLGRCDLCISSTSIRNNRILSTLPDNASVLTLEVFQDDEMFILDQPLWLSAAHLLYCSDRISPWRWLVSSWFLPFFSPPRIYFFSAQNHVISKFMKQLSHLKSGRPSATEQRELLLCAALDVWWKTGGSNSSGLEILYGCGNNEHAIHLETDLLPALLSLYCLEISGFFINATSAVIRNIKFDFNSGF